MKISKLELGNYKSIKDLQTIDFSSQLISLIGKNGSGKTNFLDALSSIYDSRNSIARSNMNYHFYLELTDKELAKFAKTVKISSENRLIEAYSTGHNGGGLNIDRIKSPILNNLLSNVEKEIYAISKKLKNELKNFDSLLKNLCADRNNYEVNYALELHFENNDIHNSTNYEFMIWNFRRQNESLIENVEKIISEHRKDNEIVLNPRSFYSYPHFNLNKFEITYARPKLTKFESKYIKIDEEAIKEEIIKINRKTKEQTNLINNLCLELKKTVDMFNSMIDKNSKYEENSYAEYQNILQRVISLCNPRAYYLRNENSRLFFKDDNDSQYYYDGRYEKAIIENFIKFRYFPADEKEFQKKVEEKKLSPEEKKKFSFDLESFINKNLPSYERDMIKEIKVSEDLNFSIIERTGEQVPFNKTNAGRRWYFTYFFVKGCLKPGDVLLMDEPANNLHPEAQASIRKEIEDISKQNLVILTTHSPYMISPSSKVYCLEMGDNGTQIINKNNDEGLKSIFLDLGFPNIDAIIGDILLNDQLLTFAEMGQKIRVALKKKKITQREVADDLGIELREFSNKLNGKHLTYCDVCWICKTYKLNPLEIILKK